MTTGVAPDGKAVVVADERVQNVGNAVIMWQRDAAPVMGNPVLPPVDGWWPPAGGVRVSLSTRAPDRLAREAGRPSPFPDIHDAAGFHASRSADIVIVIAGRIWCELDDGVEVELNAGDVLVQNGTRHRWRNHGEDWPVMAVMIVGAKDKEDGV
ncbi:cupin domain-containing protein [Sphingomonas sp. CGMCC 1.13654]|uniref:Cupin domain-containing protein n=1 Tax=Sphingomonas chungangi TaxID=2683589 RepID=A0A838L5R6_9SPHN|nr:cupin domain-containing protein [Sphingomonas chungangi]